MTIGDTIRCCERLGQQFEFEYGGKWLGILSRMEGLFPTGEPSGATGGSAGISAIGTSDSKGGKGNKAAEALATGGSRSTSIAVNISKFFDNIYVTMADRTDTAELERIVLQSMNRALAIATSTER